MDDVLMISRLARRPKNLKYTPELVTVEDQCDSAEDAKQHHDAWARDRAKKSASSAPVEEPPPAPGRRGRL